MVSLLALKQGSWLCSVGKSSKWERKAWKHFHEKRKDKRQGESDDLKGHSGLKDEENADDVLNGVFGSDAVGEDSPRKKMRTHTKFTLSCGAVIVDETNQVDSGIFVDGSIPWPSRLKSFRIRGLPISCVLSPCSFVAFYSYPAVLHNYESI